MGLKKLKSETCIHVSGTRHADVRGFSSALHGGRISCALSHAAVKDSCHPVSGSNTHKAMRKRALSRGDARDLR